MVTHCCAYSCITLLSCIISTAITTGIDTTVTIVYTLRNKSRTCLCSQFLIWFVLFLQVASSNFSAASLMWFSSRKKPQKSRNVVSSHHESTACWYWKLWFFARVDCSFGAIVLGQNELGLQFRDWLEDVVPSRWHRSSVVHAPRAGSWWASTWAMGVDLSRLQPLMPCAWGAAGNLVGVTWAAALLDKPEGMFIMGSSEQVSLMRQLSCPAWTYI